VSARTTAGGAITIGIFVISFLNKRTKHLKKTKQLNVYAGFQVKPIGTSLTTCVNWALVFAVTYVSNELTRLAGQAGCFLTFAAFCLMGAAFAVAVVPETKNKTLADIQLELVGGGRAPRALVPPTAVITMQQVMVAVEENPTTT